MYIKIREIRGVIRESRGVLGLNKNAKVYV
jgi:hypothetical protein